MKPRLAVGDEIDGYRVESVIDPETFEGRHLAYGTAHTLHLLARSPSDRPLLLVDGVPAWLRAPVVDEAALDAPIPFAALGAAEDGLEAPPTIIPPEDEVEPLVLTEARFVSQRVQRPLWMWPAALGAAVVVAAVPLGLVFLLGFGGPEPAVSPVERPSVALSLPVTAPVAEPVAPEALPSARRSAPPVHDAEEVVEEEAPVAIAASVAADPSDAGSVVVEGDATGVWLERGGRRIEARGPIKPGNYVVRAAFGDGLRRKAGKIVVRPGVETRVRCAAFVYACTELPQP